VGVPATDEVAVGAALGVLRALAAGDSLPPGVGVGVSNGLPLGSAVSVAVPSREIVAAAVTELQREGLVIEDADAPAVAVLGGDAVNGGLCEAKVEGDALMGGEADSVEDAKPLREGLDDVAPESDCNAEAAAEELGAETVGAGLPEEVADARGVAVKARDAVAEEQLNGDAEALAAGGPLGRALPDGRGEADTEREAKGDGDAEGQALGEGLAKAVRVSSGEAVEEAVSAAREAVTGAVGEGGAGEGEGEALTGVEEEGLAVTPAPGLPLAGAVIAPDAEGACGVGVPEPLCPSLAVEEADTQALAEGLSDAPLLALTAPEAQWVDEEEPKAAVGDELADAVEDTE
jgi:hypothetical protein